MAYTVNKIESKPQWFAVMDFTIPDFSRDTDVRAMYSMRSELARLGIELASPEYNYMIGYDSDDRIEVVDVKLFVAIEAPTDKETTLTFIEKNDTREIIRIETDSFEDVHTGLAEWMHDNDYVGDGDVRRVLVKDSTRLVFDSPVKNSDE
ncbi:hypothetical protein [Erysipelothrix aquatica]|uniref:hypothetical protein n=1 Tax=Erysipelothrix aquatica TaxID=2683714 RepID=UPI0013590698|nr:hypothetical protein [Erysipelothrix aquatica]